MTIVHVGLGAIGTPIAMNFLESGLEVVAVDPYLRNSARDELAAAGAVLGSTIPETLADDVSAIVTVLPDSEAVDAVAETICSSWSRDRGSLLWIDMTSAQPDRTVALAQRLQTHGITLVDAPICAGGVPGARKASLTVCVGADDEGFSRAKPILDATASAVLHVGGTGSGHFVKLLSNYVALGTVALMAETFSLARDHGIDHDALWDVLSQCAAASFVNLDQVRQVTGASDSANPPNFRLALARKDMRYLVTYAALLGTPLPMGEGGHAHYLTAENAGMAGREAVQAVMDAVGRGVSA